MKTNIIKIFKRFFGIKPKNHVLNYKNIERHVPSDENVDKYKEFTKKTAEKFLSKNSYVTAKELKKYSDYIDEHLDNVRKKNVDFLKNKNSYKSGDIIRFSKPWHTSTDGETGVGRIKSIDKHEVLLDSWPWHTKLSNIIEKSTIEKYYNYKQKKLIESENYKYIMGNGYTNFIVGTSNKGPYNKPVHIDSWAKLVETFGDPGWHPVSKKGKQIFNENDPYGEENWED